MNPEDPLTDVEEEEFPPDVELPPSVAFFILFAVRSSGCEEDEDAFDAAGESVALSPMSTSSSSSSPMALFLMGIPSNKPPPTELLTAPLAEEAASTVMAFKEQKWASPPFPSQGRNQRDHTKAPKEAFLF